MVFRPAKCRRTVPDQVLVVGGYRPKAVRYFGEDATVLAICSGIQQFDVISENGQEVFGV